MPRRRIKEAPPTVTTWGSALPVLIVAVLFDILRAAATWLWLLAPTIAAGLCSHYTGFTLLCVGVSGIAGTAAAPALTMAGAAIAMVIGITGWIVVMLLMLLIAPRVLARGMLMMGLSFVFSELPILNSVPALTLAIWRMYHQQIKADKEAMKKYQERMAAQKAQETRERMAELARAREEEAYATAELENEVALEQEEADAEQQIAQEEEELQQSEIPEDIEEQQKM